MRTMSDAPFITTVVHRLDSIAHTVAEHDGRLK
jgi:hypothetical protein